VQQSTLQPVLYFIQASFSTVIVFINRMQHWRPMT